MEAVFLSHMAQTFAGGAMMTEKIREQILSVRETGRTNMFDVPMVQNIANEMGFYELVIFLAENRREYAHFILTGEPQ